MVKILEPPTKNKAGEKVLAAELSKTDIDGINEWVNFYVQNHDKDDHESMLEVARRKVSEWHDVWVNMNPS